MILAIVSFAIELIFLAVTNGLSNAKALTKEFAIFVIVVYVVCTIASLVCIIYNGKRIKDSTVSKGVSVTGLVFSIVGSVIGLIFCITVFATLAALSQKRT